MAAEPKPRSRPDRRPSGRGGEASGPGGKSSGGGGEAPTTGDGWSDVERAVAAHYERLGPGQRRVVDRLLSDTRYAAMSAAELAREVDVDESTVTRAAQALGFAGYPDVRTRLRERLLSAVPERVQAAVVDLGDTPEAAAVRAILEDADSLRATAQDLHAETLGGAVDALVAAPRVLIFGSRGSYGLAMMLEIGLRLLRPGARLLSQAAGDLADQLVDLAPDDTLVVISMRRVDRVGVDVLRHAARVGARTVAITDHRSNPVARAGEHTLIARLAPLRLLPSYASGASLVHALLTVVALRTHGAESAARLEAAEQLWSDFGTHAES